MNGQFAVMPDIRHWHGDLRRDWSPYFVTGGLSYACLNTAQWGAMHLRKRGISCYLEVIANDGRKV